MEVLRERIGDSTVETAAFDLAGGGSRGESGMPVAGAPILTRGRIIGAAVSGVLVLVVLAVAYRAFERRGDAGAESSPVVPSPTGAAPAETKGTEGAGAGFLYGRITTLGGARYEGRLRWGGDQEAFWGDYFDGAKRENRWLAQLPAEYRPTERRSIAIFGVEIFRRGRPKEIGRPFMARFGDLARIAAAGASVRVTLKSGSVVELDRFEAGDFDDGVRVWDARRGVVDLDSGRILAIELLPAPPADGAPTRLRGTVRTRHGGFSGFLQWNREACVGSDELRGRGDGGELRLRFDAIRAIARRAPDRALVVLRDGSEVLLSGARAVGKDHRGTYVDDRRYGRVLVSWDATERVDFQDAAQGDSGPAYGDFPPGRPLDGSVVTRAGRRLAGRLVYDLDESETTDTLDAPLRGVDYTLPFGAVASIVRSGGRDVRVILRSGEELPLEPAGDLGEGNAGILVFAGGRERPDFVPWSDVVRVDFVPPDLPGATLGTGPGLTPEGP